MVLTGIIRHWLALILLTLHTCSLFSDMFAGDACLSGYCVFIIGSCIEDWCICWKLTEAYAEINIKIKTLSGPQTGRSFSFLFFTFPSMIHVLCLLHEQFAMWSSASKENETCLTAFYGRTTQFVLLLLQVSQITRYLVFPFCPQSNFSGVTWGVWQ